MTLLNCLTPKIGIGKHSVQLSFTGTKLYRFEVLTGCNANF